MLTEIVNISASFCLDAQVHFQLKGEHKRATFLTNVKCKDRTGSLVVCFLLPCQLNLITILIMLLYSFRCRGALVSPREQQIDIYNSWIQQMRSEISKRGRSQSQTEIRREIDEHEVIELQIWILNSCIWISAVEQLLNSLTDRKRVVDSLIAQMRPMLKLKCWPLMASVPCRIRFMMSSFLRRNRAGKMINVMLCRGIIKD